MMRAARRTPVPPTLKSLALVALLGALGACGHMPSLRWPWHHKPPPAPEVVHELVVTPADGTPAVDIPQYWKRNTLVLDLKSAAGTGSAVLRPREGGSWPVRLALRVMPGTVGVIEVRADQRMLLPVTAAGTKPVDLELPPGIYTAKSPQITVQWGPASP